PGYYSPTDNNTPIAILDSGLAADASLEKFVLSSLDVMAPTAPISDTLGHGTQMALIATGVVKPYGFVDDNDSYIPIIPIRAFDDNGFTTDLMILDAINFALENNARILSLSWGSETKSDFMERTLSYANDMGLIIVASAGNEPTGRPVYPAAYPSVIGIGALEPHGKTWENSNFGNFVTLYAPGFALLPVGYKGDPGVYAGTSISAAFVANTLAGFLSKNPAATPQEIRNFLQTKFNGS
ncbi:MAG: S8 family serine peptidase, partial [Deltaproteobacteria bacterium]|nr:S8 family serine peptidase [Deltaproteobacteria bacterium]